MIKDYLKILKLFPVACRYGGMDGVGLKLEKIGQFFQVLMLCVPKILKTFRVLWLALSDKIHLISLSYSFTEAFCLRSKPQSNDFSTELALNSKILVTLLL